MRSDDGSDGHKRTGSPVTSLAATEPPAGSGNVVMQDLNASDSKTVETEPGDRLSSSTALAPAGDSVRENAQTHYLLHNLDSAVDRWHAYGETAPPNLTRSGLDALATGVDLTSDQRSILLRSALYHGGGVLTALHYQDDPELTALILAEALTTSSRPISAETVIAFAARDAQGDVWFGRLVHELRYAASSSDVRMRRRAVDALWRLQGGAGQAVVGPSTAQAAGSRPTGKPAETVRDWRGSMFLALVLTAAILVFVLAGWQVFGDDDELARLPAGEYLLRSDGGERRVSTTGFSIQRHEVKNRDYRRCAATGRCTVPGSTVAGGIDGYTMERAYDSYPAVNVTYAQAAEYCAAQGMRLPSAAEWTLAASTAPSTGDALVYPWGVEHQVQRANTIESGLGRPTEVGSFSPAGDSSIGAADMGGNVAEWTMTTRDEGDTRVVKGGSYREAADATRTASEQQVEANGFGDWIGFRCVQPSSALVR